MGIPLQWQEATLIAYLDKKWGFKKVKAAIVREFQKKKAKGRGRAKKKVSGQSRGFGFVCFNSQTDANRAICQISGRTVRGKVMQLTHSARAMGEFMERELDAFLVQRQMDLSATLKGTINHAVNRVQIGIEG